MDQHDNNYKKDNSVYLKIPFRVDNVLVDNDKNGDGYQDIKHENDYAVPWLFNPEFVSDFLERNVPKSYHISKNAEAIRLLQFQQKYLFY